MIALITAILTATLAGYAVTRAIDRSVRGALLAGLSIPYGCGLIMFVLLLLSLAHIRWSLRIAVTASLIVAIVAWFTVKAKADETASRNKPHVIDIASLVIFVTFVVFAAAASPFEWDFWSNWGLKARVFLEYRGIDWSWLQSPWNDFAHPDYPLLVPLNYAWAELFTGTWNDRWLGLLSAVWAAAVLLIVRSLTASEAPALISATATFAAAPVATALTIGTAEGALIAMSGAGILFLRRALRDGPSADWRHGALLLGLAANCKNEGLVLIGAAAIGIVIADPRRWRRALHLWPAVMVGAPWLLLRIVYRLPTDIVSGDIVSRAGSRLMHPGAILAALAQTAADRWVWIAVIATVVVVPGALARERFILTTTFTQIAVYVASYFVTPYNVSWHIATSWERLSHQMELPITVTCVMLLGCLFFPIRAAPAATSSPSATI